MWLGLLLMVLMGFSLGLLGGGGSILAVPILVYFFKLDAHTAIAVSLVLVGSTALLAALMHHRQAHVNWRGGALVAGFGAPASVLGAYLSRGVPGPLLLFLFGALMLITCVAMLRPRRGAAAPEHPKSFLRLAATGLGVGLLTGLLGVGGGFMIVPALVLVLRMPMKAAVGTSLLVIAANCVFALAGRLHLLHMEWHTVALMSTSALVGTLAGYLLSQRVDAAGLRRSFGVLILLVGLFMVARNFSAVLPH